MTAKTNTSAAEALPLRLEGVLPPTPPPTLDPFLDAAARCFERFGIRRTAVPDIAREMGVSRVTVYRRVGTVDELARLLFARELYRLLTELAPVVAAVQDPDDLALIIERVVTYAGSHPVLRKILSDEPDLAGLYLVEGLPEIVARVVGVASPLLRAAMDRGAIARRDADVLAEWLVRITASIVLAPPKNLRSFLRAVIEPVCQRQQTDPSRHRL